MMEPVKVSVAMAVKNGALYIRQQLESIVPQLGDMDEVVVSDDQSTDQTVRIIAEMNDKRIRCLSNTKNGLLSNFENSLKNTSGDIVFLCDQDDVWLPGKVEKMKLRLRYADLVLCDCRIVNNNLEVIHNSFFALNNSKSGLIRNFFRNSYMGCCMAFKREVLKKALPFPAKIHVHDLWIGLVAEMYFKTDFLEECLVLHRRHNFNASTTSRQSTLTLQEKVALRMVIAKELLNLKYDRKD